VMDVLVPNFPESQSLKIAGLILARSNHYSFVNGYST
jgi:hypothetical protein